MDRGCERTPDRWPRSTPYTHCVPGLSDVCGTCGQDFLYALPRCPICHKSVCEGCAKRMGGSTFCSTDCSHAFFFGGEDEVADAEADRSEEGE